MNRTIYLAGGCFWGMEAYFGKIYGVNETAVGYANGIKENPTYEEVCSHTTKFAETLKLEYDNEKVSLDTILTHYFRIIDPVSVNRQGGDFGDNYRTGIYYVDESALPVINKKMSEEQEKYPKKLAVEVLPLTNFFMAEEYHQKYLKKNPDGYCHINLSKADLPVVPEELYSRPNEEELRKNLSDEQYNVLVKSHTETPFKNEYDEHFEKGIYVDIASGEPLFSSRDKFNSGCGWPAFSKPIAPETVNTLTDTSHGMVREEVRARVSEGHLGHVFDDGPKESGGLRYCINSAALKFIPEEEMDEKGYGYLKGEI